MQNKLFVVILLVLFGVLAGYKIYDMIVEDEPEKIPTLKELNNKPIDNAVKAPEGYSEKEINKYGVINTVVDGFDVKQVNLWSSIEQPRQLKGYVLNKERVKIRVSEGDYYLVESSSGIIGYCRKGFLKLELQNK